MLRYSIILLVLLSACTAPIDNGSVGSTCTHDTDCQLPMDYAVRSMCPFSAHCVDGSCKVACIDYSPRYVINDTNTHACTRDDQCDCRFYVATDAKRCACVNGACGVIVAE